LSRRGGHHRIPKEDRDAVLGGDKTFEGILGRILEGQSRKIIVLLGAGASTAAGIPDFRSPMGLWSQPAMTNLFSLSGFFDEPESFWVKAHELFSGRKPTLVHKFVSQLESKGILQRVYTQNIDGLEEAAGIPLCRVVQCHGSANRLICSAVREHSVDVGPADIEQIAQTSNWRAPRCKCGALLRPDIIFFGEPLPERFAQLHGQDFQECDLLLVIGTALSVYPVAGLVQRVGPLTPRVLINKEAVGVWTCDLDSDASYRDVLWKGDCDAGVAELARLLGWPL